MACQIQWLTTVMVSFPGYKIYSMHDLDINHFVIGERSAQETKLGRTFHDMADGRASSFLTQQMKSIHYGKASVPHRQFAHSY